MLIHFIGVEPVIDCSYFPRSIVLRHAYRCDIPNAELIEYRLSMAKNEVLNHILRPSVEKDVKALPLTSVRLTRLSATSYRFHVYKVPLFDTLRLQNYQPMMVVIEAKSGGGAFVYIGKWSDKAMYRFTDGTRYPIGGIIMRHASYSAQEAEPIPDELVIARRSAPIWRRLISED